MIVRESWGVDKIDLTGLHLDVYSTRDGPWTLDHGDLVIPDDWDFLPSGDAFVTRRVKAAGRFWVAWRPRGRNRPHSRQGKTGVVCDLPKHSERPYDLGSSFVSVFASW